MNGTDSTTFNAIEARHKSSKARVTAALTGKKDTDADKLVRWVFLNDVPPHEVFSDPAIAAEFSTFEGVVNVIERIQSGERIAFVRTMGAGPRIAFLNRKDKAFNRDFLAQISGYNLSQETVKSFYKPNGFLETIHEFFADVKQYQERRRSMAEDIGVFQTRTV